MTAGDREYPARRLAGAANRHGVRRYVCDVGMQHENTNARVQAPLGYSLGAVSLPLSPPSPRSLFHFAFLRLSGLTHDTFSFEKRGGIFPDNPYCCVFVHSLDYSVSVQGNCIVRDERQPKFTTPCMPVVASQTRPLPCAPVYCS